MNKYALSRYLLIDELLRLPRVSTLEDIIAYIAERMDMKISKRTVQLDIQEMRYNVDLGFNAPIQVNTVPGYSGRKYYQYTDKTYTIRKNLNLTDMNLIEISDPKLADTIDAILQEIGAQETISTIYSGEDGSLLTQIKAKMVEAADEIDEHQEEDQPAALVHSLLRVKDELMELSAMMLRYLKQFDHKEPELETTEA